MVSRERHGAGVAQESRAEAVRQHRLQRRIAIGRGDRHGQQRGVGVGEATLRHQAQLDQDGVEALVGLGGGAAGAVERPLVAMALAQQDGRQRVKLLIGCGRLHRCQVPCPWPLNRLPGRSQQMTGN